ncbi:MAG: hypothetical protein IKW49_06535 [Opitutales bacterium]|nr:hypothetical protein [Opitutales bacterium]
MKFSRLSPRILALFSLCSIACAAEKPSVSDLAPGVEISVSPLPALGVEGTKPAQGVAGAFASCDGANIYVGGGALFPEKGPADGGKKRFYDTIWQLSLTDFAAGWQPIWRMPEPIAYGVSAGDTWIGGENDEGKSDGQCTFFRYQDEVMTIERFPVQIDNAAGNYSFIGGGNINGVPGNKAFRLAPHKIEALPDFPGTPRIQPVAGLLRTPRGTAFALVGGFYFDKESKKATVDRAGVIYYMQEKKWEKLPPLPESVSEAGLVGSCAVDDERGGMLIFGGVNAKIFKDALEKPAPDYLRHDPAWYKFNADILRLSFGKDGKAKWEKLASVPATARAGASVVKQVSSQSEKIFFICGELKPGFRSTDCCVIEIKIKD